MNHSDVNAFAMKYLDLYRNPKTTNFQVEETFADECFALGFEMDSGNSFCEKYPKAFNDTQELDKIIEDIDDPKFLGTAIFSQWRYITHWSYCSHPLDTEYRPWFITAFGRLVAITSEDDIPPYVFYGNVTKVKIHSNNIYYGLLPREGLEIEQHLTITDDGRVWLTRYAFDEDLNYAKFKKTEQKHFKIDAAKARFLLDKFTQYFRDEYEISFATDVGCFDMQITDDEGKKAVFAGPLICDFEIDGYNLSQLVRDTLDDQTLFVFDGNNYERIEKITIDHEYKKNIVAADGQRVVWNPTDHIVIDRATDIIEYTYKIGSECDVTRKYHVSQGIASFLDDLDIETLFTDFEAPAEDVILPESEESSYNITVSFLRQPDRIVSGRYDKKGLPTDWPEFIENLYSFMSFYGFGEMFDEAHYGRTYRKNGEYIFLSVRFGDYGKTYYYLTDDDSIEVGDKVIVPVGTDGTERIVEVAKIQYFSADSVPMPIEKVKSVLGKFKQPTVNAEGKRMIYCPMCEKDIDADDCYDLLYDPLVEEIPGVISKDAFEAKKDICERCKYHDE